MLLSFCQFHSIVDCNSLLFAMKILVLCLVSNKETWEPAKTTVKCFSQTAYCHLTMKQIYAYVKVKFYVKVQL